MNDVQVWDAIDYRVACAHYNSRYEIHERLLKAFQENAIHSYVDLALGIEEAGGNYSAAEHGLGPIILQQSSHEKVFQLARRLYTCQVPAQIPDIIYAENIPFLKVSVGSEMAALLKPELFWVANTRTIWAHLVMKHKNVQSANFELRAYHEEMPSEMAYHLWKQIYPLVGSSMTILASLGTKIAQAKGIEPGTVRFLWADAIADTSYNKYSH
jgi:hypothetical protein